MPPAIRALATILIGIPGAILQVGGLILLGLGIPATTLDLEVGYAPRFSILGLFVFVAIAGFGMVTLVELTNGILRYRMPARRLPAYIGLELLEQLLGTGLVGLLVTAILAAGSDQQTNFGIWALVACLVAGALAFCISRRRACGSRWRKESPDAAPLPGAYPP